MVDVVQLVRASDCGSECRRFESGLPPPLFLTIKENLHKLIAYGVFFIKRGLFREMSLD